MKHKQWVRLTGGYITTTAGPDWADHVIAEVRDESAADLLTAAPDLLRAAELALPWLGKLIADGGHLNSVGPGYAVRALDALDAAITKAGGQP